MGAAISWNRSTRFDTAFELAVSRRVWDEEINVPALIEKLAAAQVHYTLQLSSVLPLVLLLVHLHSVHVCVWLAVSVMWYYSVNISCFSDLWLYVLLLLW